MDFLKEFLFMLVFSFTGFLFFVIIPFKFFKLFLKSCDEIKNSKNRGE